MKQVVVLSGKGGTGKTSLVASLAYLAGNEAVVVDADVDAPNLELLAESKPLFEEPLFWGRSAVIDYERCVHCLLCVSYCRFSALHVKEGLPEVDPRRCEGCGVCQRVCNFSAIEMRQELTGRFFISKTRWNNFLFHARLAPSGENSGKMVTYLRRKAEEKAKAEEKKYLLIDGSPGIGCTVISSMVGVDLALLVSEPTLSGQHDLERIVALARHFGIPHFVVVNKADLSLEGRNRIREFCSLQGIELIAEIPFDQQVLDALMVGIPVIEYDHQSPFSQGTRKIWQKIRDFFQSAERSEIR
ncbi:4Fe-4S binding protein [Atrimonas thermophila]|uniref:nucleotide-binding protein n=1 Tax=Atrimonas thermophila TaxID=3064161 RepID=UPI00399CFB09